MKHFLIVVDMQKDFVDGALGTPEAQAIVGKVMDKILGFDGQIFATLDTHRENYPDTAEGKKLPVPHCIKGTPGWMLDSGVAAGGEADLRFCAVAETAVSGSGRGDVHHGTGRAVYGHLRGVQRPDAESEFPGDGDFCGQRLLRGRHPGDP